MEKLISSCKIIYFDKKKNEITSGYFIGLINADLLNKLTHFYQTLGVQEYEEFSSHTRWGLNGKWYSSAQIERIASMKIFI